MRSNRIITFVIVSFLLLGSCVGGKKAKDKEQSVAVSTLAGSWTLTLLKGTALPEGASVPTLQVDLSARKVFGHGGCNRYFASINKYDDESIELGSIGATRMACLGEQIEGEYLEALVAVRQYRLGANKLQLLSGEGVILLEYSGGEAAPNPNLGDVWAVTHLGDRELKLDALPYLGIDLQGMSVSGNNGCNQFMGPLKRVTDTILEFGDIAMTMQMCDEMEIPQAINVALANVRSYRLDELSLKLFDVEGKLLMTLRKAD